MKVSRLENEMKLNYTKGKQIFHKQWQESDVMQKVHEVKLYQKADGLLRYATGLLDDTTEWLSRDDKLRSQP